MSIKRVFLIVLDSAGVGELPDAKEYGDVGCNTLKSCFNTGLLEVPMLRKLGLFHIDENDYGKEAVGEIQGSFGRLAEKSKGKDTTTGHWEIAGLVSEQAMPTYPNGFPQEVLDEFSKRTGRGVLCNLPYSGTDVIRDYGKEQLETGNWIVYTSADSVFQIAAHEEYIPLEELYKACETARELLQGEHGVGRVIARPYKGEVGAFERTANRHDYSLIPPKATVCDLLKDGGYDVIGIGKIYDIFAGKSITETTRTKSNFDGMEKTIELLDKDFNGLAFTNLVDFDMKYGHRNDADGYAKALNEFDMQLKEFMAGMKDSDVVMITADHGCDPAADGTDHTREYIPLLVYGKEIQRGKNFKTRDSFADIAATIADIFEVKGEISGTSLKKELI